MESAEYFKDIIVTSPDGIWTDARAYNTLNEAVSAVGSNERTIIIANEQTVTDLTIPANITLEFKRGGSISNSGTLTINTRKIIASDYPIFTGSGSINFSPGSVIRSSWFSSFIDAINKTFNSDLTLIISEPSTISSNCSVGDDVTLMWESSNNLLTVDPGITLSNINSIIAEKFQLFAGSGNFVFAEGSVLKSSWFASLRAANEYTYGTGTHLTIVIDKSETVNCDLTFNEYQMVRVNKGCVITITTDNTLTFEGSFEAGLYKVFNCIGTGKVIFKPKSVVEAYPQWWGAYSDNTHATETALAINAMADACRPYLIPIKFPSGKYRVDRSLNFTEANQNSTQEGAEGWIISGSGHKSTVIVPVLIEPFPVIDILGGHELTLKDMAIYEYGEGGLQTAGVLAGSTPSRPGCYGQKLTNFYVRGYFNTGAGLIFSCGDCWILDSVIVSTFDCPAAVFTDKDVSAGVSYMEGPVNSKFTTIEPQGNTYFQTRSCSFSSQDGKYPSVTMDGYTSWYDFGSVFSLGGSAKISIRIIAKPGGSRLHFLGFRMECNHSDEDTIGIHISDESNSAVIDSFLLGTIGSDTPNSVAIKADIPITNTYLAVTTSGRGASKGVLSGDIVGSIIQIPDIGNQEIVDYTSATSGNIVLGNKRGTNWESREGIYIGVDINGHAYLYNNFIKRFKRNYFPGTDVYAVPRQGILHRKGDVLSSGIGEEVLASYTIPISLAENDDRLIIDIDAVGVFAYNTNLKEISCYLVHYQASSATFYENKIVSNDDVAPSNVYWSIKSRIYNLSRYSVNMIVGSTYQKYNYGIVSSVPYDYENDTLTIEIRANSSVANDVRLYQFVIEV